MFFFTQISLANGFGLCKENIPMFLRKMKKFLSRSMIKVAMNVTFYFAFPTVISHPILSYLILHPWLDLLLPLLAIHPLVAILVLRHHLLLLQGSVRLTMILSETWLCIILMLISTFVPILINLGYILFINAILLQTKSTSKSVKCARKDLGNVKKFPPEQM